LSACPCRLTRSTQQCFHAQEELQSRHGSHLAELQGVRLLPYAEKAAAAAAAHGLDDREADAESRLGRFSLESYCGLRRLSLCQVRDDLVSRHGRLPVLPAGLQELTLEQPPADSDGDSVESEDFEAHAPKNLDMRHLTALTQLTLVRMTSALLTDELVGDPEYCLLSRRGSRRGCGS